MTPAYSRTWPEGLGVVRSAFFKKVAFPRDLKDVLRVYEMKYEEVRQKGVQREGSVWRIWSEMLGKAFGFLWRAIGCIEVL